MKRLLWFGLLTSSLIPVELMAQSPFDGTWKLDPNSGQFEGKPDVYLLKDGVYRCPTCDPPLEVKADGQEQTVTGDPCYDTISIRAVDDRTIEEIHKKKGRIVENARMTLSADGNTTTIEWTTRCNAKGESIMDTTIMSRVAQSPPGAHAISGSWRKSKKMNFSGNALTGILKLEGNTFSFYDPAGQGYTAKLDGSETRTKGELGHRTVSVRLIGEDTVEETNREDGKVVEIVRYTVSTDGKTIALTIENKRKGTTSRYKLEKQ